MGIYTVVLNTNTYPKLSEHFELKQCIERNMENLNIPDLFELNFVELLLQLEQDG